jgi:hypothetical protein
MSTTLSQNGGQTATISCPASRCPLPAWSRTFSSADALLDHARQTRTLHPLCTTCNRVFKDTAALDQVCLFISISFSCCPTFFNGIFCALFLAARRSKTRRSMSALQPKIQIPIRSRPTLARFDRASQLSHLRGRRPRYKRSRRGEILHR